jgi:hypothetical protein
MLNHLMQNPVFFKETKVLPKRKGMMFQKVVNVVVYPLFYVVPFLFVSLTYLSTQSFTQYLHDIKNILQGCFYFSIGAQFFYILGSVMNNTQHAFTREKEQKTYDSLVSTLMTPKEIMMGKMAVGIYPLMLSLGAYAPLFFLMGILGGCTTFGLVSVFVFSFCFAIFCGVVGLFSSVISPEGKRAQSTASTILGILILGTGFLDFLAYMGVHTVIPGSYFFPLFSFFNIGAGYASAIYCCSANAWNHINYFHFFWLGNLVVMALMTIILWKLSLNRLKDIPRE